MKNLSEKIAEVARTTGNSYNHYMHLFRGHQHKLSQFLIKGMVSTWTNVGNRVMTKVCNEESPGRSWWENEGVTANWWSI